MRDTNLFSDFGMLFATLAVYADADADKTLCDVSDVARVSHADDSHRL
jgi:hypothetical protein